MRYTWDDHVTLKWGEVYINTIELMTSLALRDWNADFGLARLEVYAGRDFTTKIVLTPSEPSTQTKYLVWALYEISGQLTSRHASHYGRLLVWVLLHGLLIGLISYDSRQPELANYLANSTLLLDGTYPSGNRSTLASGRPSDPLPSTSVILTAKYAAVTDVDDPKLKVWYQFDGVKILPARIFSVYMDALAIAAPHDSDETGVAMTSWSLDRHASINVRRNPSYMNFTWGQLIRALRTIWRQIIVRYGSRMGQARFESMNFLVEYNGKLVGEGFLIHYDRSQRPVAVSR